MAVNIYIALGYFVRFLEILIFAYCILSWFPRGIYGNPIVDFIRRLVEPMLSPIRNLVYRSPLGGPGMMLDISPIILLLIIDGLYSILSRVFLSL